MAPKYIDPEDQGIHPLRHELENDDWARLDHFMDTGQGEVTSDELEAYNDWLFDELAGRLQTHLGVCIEQ